MSQRSPTTTHTHHNTNNKRGRSSGDDGGSGGPAPSHPRLLRALVHDRLAPPGSATRLQGFGESDRLRVCVALLRNLQSASDRLSAYQPPHANETELRALIASYTEVAYRELGSPALRLVLSEQTGLPLPYYDAEDHAVLAQWAAQGAVDLDETRRQLEATVDASPIQDDGVQVSGHPHHQHGWLLSTPLRSLSHHCDLVLDMRLDPRVHHPWAALIQWYFETHDPMHLTAMQRALFRRSLGHALQWVTLRLMDLRFLSVPPISAPFVEVSLRTATDRPLAFRLYADDPHERALHDAALRGLMQLDAFVKEASQIRLWAYSLRLAYHAEQFKRTRIAPIQAAIDQTQARIVTLQSEAEHRPHVIAEMESKEQLRRLLTSTLAYHTILQASRPHYPMPINAAEAPRTTPEYIDALITSVDLTNRLHTEGEPFLREVLMLGLHLEQHLSVPLPTADGPEASRLFYHFPIVCLGQINLLVIERKQAYHPWSRFFAWFLRYTSQMPQAYRTRLENEGYRTQTLTVTEALTVVFDPYDRVVHLRLAQAGACLVGETLELYHVDPAVRYSSEQRLLQSVIHALAPVA